MRGIQRPILEDLKWVDWCARARDATTSMIESHQPGDEIKIKETLYKEAMPFLRKLFDGKCAYCEASLNNQPGDVEHYRPKGRVRDRQGIVKVRQGADLVDHPGYWWLAYDWPNLLPACIDCNRRRAHDEGTQAGKSDFFDVQGTRAAVPSDDLALEEALLLDPTEAQFDFAEHFDIDDDGKLKPKTPRARYTEELLGLNLRELLVADRLDAYVQAKESLANVLSKSSDATPELLKANLRRINEMWEGRRPFGAFCRAGLEAARKKVQENIGVQIPLPFPIPP